jgi:hypothetical protein
VRAAEGWCSKAEEGEVASARSACERVRAEGLAQERVGRETREAVEMQMTRESPRMRVEKARTAKCRCFCSDCWTAHSSIG